MFLAVGRLAFVDGHVTLLGPMADAPILWPALCVGAVHRHSALAGVQKVGDKRNFVHLQGHCGPYI